MSIRKITLKQLAKLKEGVQVDKYPRKRKTQKRKDDSVAFCEALYALEDPRD